MEKIEHMEKKYRIVTYGCQMNVHESEKLAGILRARGYKEEAASEEEADIIVFNTCCIRENAENHAYGNIGALKKLKKARPDLLVAVGGCMTQQAGAAEKLRKKFPFVDIVAFPLPPVAVHVIVYVPFDKLFKLVIVVLPFLHITLPPLIP